jgi:hypothetical protein
MPFAADSIAGLELPPSQIIRELFRCIRKTKKSRNRNHSERPATEAGVTEFSVAALVN